MQGISVWTQYLSRVLFLTLYALDVYFAYLLTENENITAITALGLLLVLFIGSKVNLITLKAVPLRKCRSSDSERLIRCFDEVSHHGEQIGIRRRNVKLYIADNDSVNAFTIGGCIVVNRGLIYLNDTGALKAVIAHEYGHLINKDYWFSSLLRFNISAILFLFLLGAAGSFFTIVIVFAILMEFLGASLFPVLLISKLLKGMFNIIFRIYHFILNAFAAILFRIQELEADKLSIRLGYTNSMKALLEYVSRQSDNTHMTWTEIILNDHPSVYKRLARIEKIERQIEEAENHQLRRI